MFDRKKYYQEYQKKHREKINQTNREWQKRNRHKVREWEKKDYYYYRNMLFDILGHECKICGFNDKRGLCFDHIDNKGYEDRKRTNSKQLVRNYARNPITAYNTLQVLCCNCNQIKRFISGDLKENTSYS